MILKCIITIAFITKKYNHEKEFFINKSIQIKRGDSIQILLPSEKDFVFVRKQKSGLALKMLGGAADIVGTGAAAVGVGTGSVKTMQGAVKVMNGARAVKYSADALDRINELPISKKAKEIAGKKMIVENWELTDDGYILIGKLGRKSYDIYLQEAVFAGEVKL